MVAPASADLIAKASAGMADNLSLCVLRAWDFKKPLFLCPAMNTHMLDHPTTSISLQTLQTWGYRMIDPVHHVTHPLCTVIMTYSLNALTNKNTSF